MSKETCLTNYTRLNNYRVEQLPVVKQLAVLDQQFWVVQLRSLDGLMFDGNSY